MEIKQYERDGMLFFNIDGQEMPFYKEDGSINGELLDILNEEKAKQGQTVGTNTNLDEEREAEVIDADEVLVEKKNENWFKKNWKRFVAVTLAAVILAGLIALLCKSCNSNNSKKKYNYDEFFNNSVQVTMQKFEEAGYPITEQQAKDLVYGINAEEAIETGHINSNTNDVELFDNCLAYTGKIITQYENSLEQHLHSDECGKGTVKDISVAELVAKDYNDYDYQVIAKLESHQKELEKMILREKGFYSAIIRDEDKARFDEIMLEIRNFWTCSDGIKIKDGEKTVNVTLHDIGEGDKLMAAATVIYKITYLTKNINESIVYTDVAGNKVALQVPEIVDTLNNAPAMFDSAELENKLAHATSGNAVEPCEKQKVKTK